MKEIESFLNSIENFKHRQTINGVLEYIKNNYPQLKLEYKWNQPMFTHDGTFIIAFSVSKAHFSVAVEKKCLDLHMNDIIESGYRASSMLFRINFTDTVDYRLLSKLIEYNIEDKRGYDKFWR
ncbi:MAG TPA: DUF1801 domain-containing protein [Bacilli bacterium]|nr:DUF1801 domain-containing protein [Bacilli bacterium]